jgi:hypothetical protein
MIRLTLKIEFENKIRIDSMVKTVIAKEFNAIKDEIRHGIVEETICRDDGTIIKWELIKVEDPE